jgi:hypothetical protein
MKRSMSPRLRAPALFTAGALVVLAIGGATRGWSSLACIAPIPIVVLVALSSPVSSFPLMACLVQLSRPRLGEASEPAATGKR